MSDEYSCAELMQSLRAGNQDAQVQVFRAYLHRVIALARVRLKSRVKQAVGEDAVALSAMASFFLNHTEKMIDLQDENSLWGLLSEITLRHCEKWNKRFRAKKRAGTEVPLGSARDEHFFDPQDPAPGPATDAGFVDIYTQFLEQLSDRQRQVAEQQLQGSTVAESADALQISQSTVLRERREVKRILEQMLQSA
jgi:DNA-directed RNA polymerase specialized sigma24 family protein